MSRAPYWTLRAPCWTLRAPHWMLRAPSWMLRAPYWVLRAPPQWTVLRRDAPWHTPAEVAGGHAEQHDEEPRLKRVQHDVVDEARHSVQAWLRTCVLG
eukprot:825282-Prorocentrum_minimum.AAC.2